jgi:putative two-component system response regulator
MFLTGHTDAAIEAQGFELGAVDFISKPFSEPALLNRIKTHLNIDRIIRERSAMLEQQMEKLQKLKDSVVSILAEVLESNDKTTGGHVERTVAYMKLLVDAMMRRGIYADEMRGWNLDLVVSSTRMHDVGKIAVSDLILNKPGSLTSEEFEKIKIHAAEGERIIEKIIHQTGEEDFLLNAKLFAGFHHERWDGMGYPRGLKGTDIPLQGRIMAIVDVYDALVSERPYKSAITTEQAEDVILAGKGSHFDPDIVDVFFEIKDQFADVLKFKQ